MVVLTFPQLFGLLALTVILTLGATACLVLRRPATPRTTK